MSIQIKRIGKQQYKYEVTWDEKAKKQHWRYIGKVTNDSESIGKLDNSRFTDKLRFLFYASLAVSVLIGFFIQSHPYFWWVEHPGFYALYGFIACVVIVLGSKALGRYITREEDYYD